MPQPCSVCTHAKRAEIDRLVVSGEPNRRIASQCGVSEAAIRRHKASHLPKALAKAQSAKEVVQATNLLGEVQQAKGRGLRLYEAAEKILKQALDEKDKKVALQAIRAAVDVMGEARAHLQLEGEITGELNQEPQAGRQPILVIVPVPIAAGHAAPLNLAIPREGSERAIAKRAQRLEVIDVPVVREQGLLLPAA